jgi:hypothetical protein
MPPLHDELHDGIGRGVPVVPMQGDASRRERLDPEDELVFPDHKRVFTHYETREEGATELRLYYGEKEISFDEPQLFKFGEALANHPRFTAGSATKWGSQCDWPRIRELLEQLLEEGILRRAAADEPDPHPRREPVQPSPLPPTQCTVPRTWLEAETIIPELTGRSLELGYLELVLPAYRLPHVALDADGRQVGEANVFPKALRLDVPTEWRTCPHPGSRYQHKLPMNITAMKAMGVHWKQMMAALLRVREVYLHRFPQARKGWTVGDLHCLSALVLSIPTYLMLRVNDRIENGQLHPVLSSMYRLTDGVRMVMHHTLFSEDAETTLPMNAPMTSSALYAYAERNEIFVSDTGVCAGPRAMIEEFLQVLMHGHQIQGTASTVLVPPVQAAMNDLEEIFDYTLYALQAYAVVFSRWIAMARTYEQLLPIVAAWPGPTTDVLRLFRERLENTITFLRTGTQQSTEERRVKRQQVYADMYARSAHGLNTNEEPLSRAIAPQPVGNDQKAYVQLQDLLRQRFGATADDTAIGPMADVLMDYFRREQAIVRRASDIQKNINNLLGRVPPSRALTGADLAIHYRLLAPTYRAEQLASLAGRLPYLADDLRETLGLHIIARANALEIESRLA